MVAELTGNEIASAISLSGSFGRGFGEGAAEACLRGFARRSPPAEVRFAAMAVPCDLNALRLSKWCAHGARMSSADREWLGCCGSESDDSRRQTCYRRPLESRGDRRKMKNLGQMMKQAQQLQAKMNDLQEQLAKTEVTGASGGGMVQVTLNGRGEMLKVKIDPSLVDPNETEILEDLILAAFKDAKTKVEATVAERMSELTGGLQLPPGMQFPM
jgi:hypothetical protein